MPSIVLSNVHNFVSVNVVLPQLLFFSMQVKQVEFGYLLAPALIFQRGHFPLKLQKPLRDSTAQAANDGKDLDAQESQCTTFVSYTPPTILA